MPLNPVPPQGDHLPQQAVEPVPEALDRLGQAVFDFSQDLPRDQPLGLHDLAGVDRRLQELDLVMRILADFMHASASFRASSATWDAESQNRITVTKAVRTTTRVTGLTSEVKLM